VQTAERAHTPLALNTLRLVSLIPRRARQRASAPPPVYEYVWLTFLLILLSNRLLLNAWLSARFERKSHTETTHGQLHVYNYGGRPAAFSLFNWSECARVKRMDADDESRLFKLQCAAQSAGDLI
jgi:hypothetical protein